MSQSMSPAASAEAAWIRWSGPCHVPSAGHSRWRSHTVFHGPDRSSRSPCRWMPVRPPRCGIPSSTCRSATCRKRPVPTGGKGRGSSHLEYVEATDFPEWSRCLRHPPAWPESRFPLPLLSGDLHCAFYSLTVITCPQVDVADVTYVAGGPSSGGDTAVNRVQMEGAGCRNGRFLVAGYPGLVARIPFRWVPRTVIAAGHHGQSIFRFSLLMCGITHRHPLYFLKR